jgi:hypothetical protein
MSAPLRVLLVEDSPDDAELVMLELRRGGFRLEPVRVQTAAAMAEALAAPWASAMRISSRQLAWGRGLMPAMARPAWRPMTSNRACSTALESCGESPMEPRVPASAQPPMMASK